MFQRTESTILAATLRQLLTSTGSRFGSVAFVKKDGSVRRMTYVNAKHRSAHMANTERGQRAAATFAANNPNMVHVWDAHKRAFRTVNFNTILSLRVDGNTYRVRNYAEARANVR